MTAFISLIGSKSYFIDNNLNEMTKVSEISEFDLIARLETVLEQNVTPNAESKIQVAIGDDAAVIGNLDNLQVVTTDAMVDKVHFVSDEVDMRNLGWKSLAVNYSDIASMGCKPVYSVVTLGLRADISVEQLENLYLGFADLLNLYGGELVGGDIVKSDTFFISITVVGSTEKPETMQRKTAVPGDVIAVTGPLGCSNAGLRLLLSGDLQKASHFYEAHYLPKPRIYEGINLLDMGIKTGMDISDGLLNDLKKICVASSVNATINLDSIPVHEELKLSFPDNFRKMAISGGEDYELLITGHESLIRYISDSTKIDLHIVGEIEIGSGNVNAVDNSGAQISITTGGWDHFTEN